MQRLSKRLQAAADLVPCGRCVADVGTDHGYLPIYLVQSGRCLGAIAMDIREGPLERAREHIAAEHLEQSVQVRLSDGLAALEPGEADCVTITGMGGITMTKILEAGAGLLPGMKELILAPQSDIARVRRLLRQYHMCIGKEDLVWEEGKYYPFLSAVWESPAYLEEEQYITQRRWLQDQLPDSIVQQVMDQYGDYLLYHRHPLLLQLLKRDAQKASGILRSLQEHASAGKNIRRIQELEQQQAAIRILLENW